MYEKESIVFMGINLFSSLSLQLVAVCDNDIKW